MDVQSETLEFKTCSNRIPNLQSTRSEIRTSAWLQRKHRKIKENHILITNVISLGFLATKNPKQTKELKLLESYEFWVKCNFTYSRTLDGEKFTIRDFLSFSRYFLSIQMIVSNQEIDRLKLE